MNLTINDFRAMASGTHNLGHLKLSADFKQLQKVNHHFTMKSLNNTDPLGGMTDTQISLVRDAFLRALKKGGLDEDSLNTVRKDLGIAPSNYDEVTGRYRNLKPLARAEVKQILDKYKGRLGDNLEQFAKLAQGKYNAGEVAADAEGNLSVVNNHVTRTSKNTVKISFDAAVAVKRQFLKALEDKGLAGNALEKVREKLGFRKDGTIEEETKFLFRPLTRYEVRNILENAIEKGHIQGSKAENMKRFLGRDYKEVTEGMSYADRRKILEDRRIEEERRKADFPEKKCGRIHARKATTKNRTQDLHAAYKEHLDAVVKMNREHQDFLENVAYLYCLGKNGGTMTPDELRQQARLIANKMKKDGADENETKTWEKVKSDIEELMKYPEGKDVNAQRVDMIYKMVMAKMIGSLE